MTRKSLTNLTQQHTQSHRRSPPQNLANLRRLSHRCRLILRSHKRQNRALTPPHTPILQLNSNRHVLHPLQPRRCNSKRGDQGHIQGPPLRSLHIHRERLYQILEPKGRGCRHRHFHHGGARRRAGSDSSGL